MTSNRYFELITCALAELVGSTVTEVRVAPFIAQICVLPALSLHRRSAFPSPVKSAAWTTVHPIPGAGAETLELARTC